MKRPILKFLFGALTILIFAVALLFLSSKKDSFVALLDKDSVHVEIEIKEPTVKYGMIVDDFLMIEDEIKRNELLGDILEAYHVPARFIHELSNISRNLFDVRKIVPTKKYTVMCALDSAKTARALIYEPNQIDYVVLRFEDSLYVELGKREVETIEKSISGIIQNNLSQTIDEMGISHVLTNRFVDIFAWQVDFQRLQKGDKFKLIYDELQVEGQFVGVGDIKGVYFEHFNNPFYAFPFDQGEGLDYFDEEGKSLRKALLKYPIEFTRISSRYSRKRFHPVRKVYRAHLGTDFAAPTGTPIRSVGEGIVLEARYTSANGNYVKIRHNGTYSTQYLHMSHIASGVRAGTKVRQGQTIGYVGSTGLATGPHLCYRFWRNGVQVDALRVELPPSEPIKQDFVSDFEKVRNDFIKRLDAIDFPEFQEVDPIASLN